MDRQQLLAALETEIRRHDFDCFVTEPPSVAQGGTGVVVPGCPACKKKIYTTHFCLTIKAAPPADDERSQKPRPVAEDATRGGHPRELG
jgi:hypothetical protein